MRELKIFGDIGWEVRASEVDEQLASFGDEPVRVRINSGGGDVYEGIAIVNALRAYKGDVTVVIESLAASAASFIAVGVDATVVIRPNAEIMIHKAWTMLSGNADDIEKAKADLARQDVKIARMYAQRAGGELDDWLDRMAAETWYSAQEALEAGLVDEIVDAADDEKPVAAAGTRRVFAHFKYASRSVAPPPASMSHTLPTGGGQEGRRMNILEQLAQELGKEPEAVRDALSGFFDEQDGAVEVTYPEAVEVAPGGEVEAKPTPAVPEDTTVSVEADDGVTVNVEDGGKVVIRCGDDASAGDSVEVVVTVGEAQHRIRVDVVAGETSGEEAGGAGHGDGSAGESGEEEAPEMVLVPRSHLDYLTEVARNFGDAQAQIESQANNERVDRDLREGRFAAAKREEALRVLRDDPQLYAKTWGALPKGTVHVAEVGNAGAASSSMSHVEELLAKAEANRKSNKEGA